MNTEKKYLNELISEFIKISDRKVMENFLYGLLTDSELVEVPMRVQIVKMLKKGLPHHQIAKKLGVGIATVTRGSTELKKGRFKYV
ncbi:hypothetical protein A3C23_03190 [Candidatus Roizmanbacteria bacterium RIFCSPHIGHO2_02_FULL_37_13b]|uniref:Transcriptional regulator n=1 Tax=Candidatus Roizmanbacteria bacterium RIFCSPLOWO2_02_FULL_36_11 TaxID=1802071 RepID=A0A1F7JGJ6_9BACT|nr:MAG: hypothetical protein A3C23_03190 [Candidatus Roizmanbacteria bacterium RIFCSPHIGHO2_02_FULL_37_13b]OGK54734.1 MAG: hypothetical protein A3H78_05590 [Candidatus Roizmanbacteria bacterium RIFCSPLOWO2_02_FULL_36_11]